MMRRYEGLEVDGLGQKDLLLGIWPHRNSTERSPLMGQAILAIWYWSYAAGLWGLKLSLLRIRCSSAEIYIYYSGTPTINFPWARRGIRCSDNECMFRHGRLCPSLMIEFLVNFFMFFLKNGKWQAVKKLFFFCTIRGSWANSLQ